MKYVNSGVIVVNKPAGYTSRDIVNIISKKLLTKKVGHTGTLDPMATGVLVVCIGKATKLVDMLTAQSKEYTAGVLLGVETDTLDITGNVLKKDNKKIKQDEIIKALNNFIKTYNQQVPIYSAVKVNGKKLYEYARNNIEVNLPSKKVTIYSAKLIDYKESENINFTFKCKVSKGTYIRALIRDIAYSLNTVGTMTSLIRTSQGKFTIKNAYTLDDIENDKFKIIPITDLFDMKKKKVNDQLKYKIINGQKLNSEGLVMYIDENNSPLAIYENGKVLKMLYEFK